MDRRLPIFIHNIRKEEFYSPFSSYTARPQCPGFIYDIRTVAQSTREWRKVRKILLDSRARERKSRTVYWEQRFSQQQWRRYCARRMKTRVWKVNPSSIVILLLLFYQTHVSGVVLGDLIGRTLGGGNKWQYKGFEVAAIPQHLRILMVCWEIDWRHSP